MILAADCLWQSTASGPKIKIFLCFTRKDTPFICDPFLFAEFCTNTKKKNKIMGTSVAFLMAMKRIFAGA